MAGSTGARPLDRWSHEGWRKNLAWIVLYVFYPLEILVIGVQCLERLNAPVLPKLSFEVAVFAIAALLLEATPLEKRCYALQRRGVLRMQQMLGIRHGTVSELDREQWAETSVTNFRLFLPLVAALALTRYIQGQHITVSLHLLKFVMYGVAATVLAHERAVVFSLYMQVFVQVMAVRLLPNSDDAMLKGAIFSRSVFSFLLLDSAPRMGTMLIPSVLGSREYSLGFYTVLASVGLMDVLGLRSAMCNAVLSWSSKRTTGPMPIMNKKPFAQKSRHEKAILLFVFFAPFYTVMALYSPTTIKIEPDRINVALMMFSVSTSIICLFGHRFIESSFVHSRANDAKEAHQKDYLSINIILAFGITVGAVFIHFTLEWAVLATLSCGITMLIAGFLLPKQPRGRYPWAILLLLHLGLLFLGYYLEMPFKARTFELPIVLTVARCVAALDRPVFFTWTVFGLASLCSVSLALLFVVHRKECYATFSITFMSMTAVFLSSSFAVFREGKLRLISVSSQSSQFLDHAIKQRYAAVGSALEHLLDLSDVEKKAPGLFQTAKMTLNECRAGLDMCHLSASAQKLINDPALAASCAMMNLNDTLTDWTACRTFHAIDSLPNDIAMEIYVKMDRDLLKAILCSMCPAQRERYLHVRINSSPHASSVATNFVVFTCLDKAEVSIDRAGNPPRKDHFDSEHRTADYARQLRETICTAFGALMDGRSVWIPIQTSMESVVIQSSLSQNRKSDMSSMDIAHVKKPSLLLPPGLCFAILDDVKVLRTSLLRMCIRHAQGDSHESFTAGATEDEAECFVESILSKEVDVVIIDQNLEYSERLISGTDIAKQARARGFNKCLILHSANGQLRTALEPCFDGFIEKTSTKDEFLFGLTRAWQVCSARKRVSSALHPLQ